MKIDKLEKNLLVTYRKKCNGGRQLYKTTELHKITQIRVEKRNQKRPVSIFLIYKLLH